MKRGGYRMASMSALSSHKGQVGFTVVETMIVLAVTGVLFVSAVLLISGKQNRTQFVTAINGLQQQIQQLISETANGYYPRDTPFNCARGTGTPPVPLLSAQSTADRQGQNVGCIFLGKAVQFAVGNSDPQMYNVYPLVGNRMDTGGLVEASTLYGTTGTYPRAAAPGSGATTDNTLPSAAISVNLTQGLRVVNMWYGNSTTNTVGTIGFLSTLPSPDAVGLASGSQHLALYRAVGSALSQSATTAVDYMYPGKYNAQPFVQTTSVNICVASGSTDQSGLITIGQSDSSSAGSLAVNLAIRSGQAC